VPEGKKKKEKIVSRPEKIMGGGEKKDLGGSGHAWNTPKNHKKGTKRGDIAWGGESVSSVAPTKTNKQKPTKNTPKKKPKTPPGVNPPPSYRKTTLKGNAHPLKSERGKRRWTGEGKNGRKNSRSHVERDDGKRGSGKKKRRHRIYGGGDRLKRDWGGGEKKTRVSTPLPGSKKEEVSGGWMVEKTKKKRDHPKPKQQGVDKGDGKRRFRHFQKDKVCGGKNEMQGGGPRRMVARAWGGGRTKRSFPMKTRKGVDKDRPGHKPGGLGLCSSPVGRGGTGGQGILGSMSRRGDQKEEGR